MDNLELSITCDQCGRRCVVARAELEATLDEDPSLVAVLERFWARTRWIHDAEHGFAFCSDACATAHGVDERPDARWIAWVLRGDVDELVARMRADGDRSVPPT